MSSVQLAANRRAMFQHCKHIATSFGGCPTDSRAPLRKEYGNECPRGSGHWWETHAPLSY
jgi:hypothetical protein